MTTLAFRDRTCCPSCGAVDYGPVWDGRFSDPDVTRWIGQFGYSADTPAALGDRSFALVQCAACALRYHRSVIDESAVETIYRDWTDQAQVTRFEALHGAGDRTASGIRLVKLALRLRHLLRGVDAPLRWLDFGCGNGRALAAGNLLGFEMSGIDVSATRSQQAERMGAPVFADLDRFDAMGNGPVHAITLEQVLEHLLEPRELLESLRQRLLPGGVLFVAVPNCEGIDRPRDFESFHKVQPIEHVNAFTPKTLRDICERAGFRPVRRPPAFVTTRPIAALRSLGGMVWQPATTEQYFRLA